MVSMSLKTELSRESLQQAALEVISGRLPKPRHKEALAFASLLLRRVPSDDLAERDAEYWAGLSIDLLSFARARRQEQALVRVFNPDAEEQGWDSTHTVIQIVNDDMPFLVDSVSMAINQRGIQIHALAHPVMSLKRDPGGHLLSISEDLAKGSVESLIHFEVDRQTEPERIAELHAAIESALNDVRLCVRDWREMRDRMLELALTVPELPLDTSEIDLTELAEFLRWIAEDHFTFLGYREYIVDNSEGQALLHSVDGSGLGILSTAERSSAPRSLAALAGREAANGSSSNSPVILTKTNARATVHRPGYMDYIGLLRFDEHGNAIGEYRFLGLFTSSAYSRRPFEIPWLRGKANAVLARSGYKPDGHSGKAIRHILETLPRDELYQANVDELFDMVMGIHNLQERQRTRLFLRRDRFGRFFSCLVFIPRDRFNTNIRERIEAMFRELFQGEHIDATVQISESALARLHIIVRPKPGHQPVYDVDDLSRQITAIVRNWQDDLREILVDRHGEDRGVKLAQRFGRGLPAGYIDAVSPEGAAFDVECAARLRDLEDLRMDLYRAEAGLRFKLFRYASTIPLSEALPLLENMGLRVLSEHPYEMSLDGGSIWIQDFEVVMETERQDIARVKLAFETAFDRTWRGLAEDDGFNRLVLGALLEWRQVSVLRAYCKYLLQAGSPFSQSYMEQTLCRYPLIARLLVELFEAKFDPERDPRAQAPDAVANEAYRDVLVSLSTQDQRDANDEFSQTLVDARQKLREDHYNAVLDVVRDLLDGVAILDEDRILRSFVSVIGATLRTSFFQTPDGHHRETISLKFDPSRVPDLPKPRPYREIFVYSPRVEGVHLRFGPVARGGLRWSDRREDFRTEVLGLVKAQMVKNTIIVPVGAKGGFFVKRPPSGNDRDAILTEGVACYRMFINALLDITDNLLDGVVIPPERVVRHDDDDYYLVVAADKGTATFSDIANAVAAEHGYWMDDAFASGGSQGYDHKRMGITAKGAWESVKRHFRALGVDCQSQEFTCTGVGDMSGDVFGNGMLLSRHIRLVAAFDHRHIFLDPNPDAATSFAERERMFALPRSSWADYDSKLISAGGGVFPRSAKMIPISPEVRERLGIAAAEMTPNELLRAILLAPVDLFWNGGIGTYVKARSESHADVGDRANNALRVDGGELRCKVVGEGGNLGMTQLGRIEAALNGVLLNTDFIDNSAGVDTSDHEVNIKILLNAVVARGELSEDERNALLQSMTDEVEQLVLLDNYRQNQAISIMQGLTVARLGAMQHYIRTLESEGLLDRALECLPSDNEFSERRARGQGLTRPELSILLSYSKIRLKNYLLNSDVPEDEYLSRELVRYFPEKLQQIYGDDMQEHRLKREIIATAVTNSMVNRMGSDFVLRMQEDTGQPPAAIAKAFAIAREVLDSRDLWAELERLDEASLIPYETFVQAMLGIWNLLRQMSRWVLQNPALCADITQAVERYAPGVAELRRGLSGIAPEVHLRQYSQTQADLVADGVPADLARQLSELPAMNSALDIVDVAIERDLPVAEVASVFFLLGEGLHLQWLMNRIEELPVDGRWAALARGTLRDELYAHHRALTAQILADAPAKGKNDAGKRVAMWLARDEPTLRFTLSMFGELRSLVSTDYPTVSVAVRRLGQVVQAGARG